MPHALLGRKQSAEHILKRSHLGKHYPKLSEAQRGRIMSEEQKKKISITKQGTIPWNKGLTKADPRVRKYLENNTTQFKKGSTTGSKNVNWKGGITPINQRIRTSTEYKLWRKAVFERDKYTCVWCGVRGGLLHADHIKPFALFPELRLAIDNGRTLCVPCHRTTDTYAGKFFKK